MFALLLVAAMGIGPAFPSQVFGRPDTTGALELGTYPFGPGYSIAVDSVRHLAFAGAGAGVLVFDVSGPGEPVPLSDIIRGPGLVMDLCLSDQKLFVAYCSNSFNFTYPVANDVEIWDVSTPQTPTLLGSADLPYGAFSVWANDTLMLASSLRWFGAFDVSDPAQPVFVESLPCYHTACQIRVKDTFAYTAMAFAGAQVYNIADRDRLGLAATWGHGGAFVGEDLIGNRLYLANNSAHGVAPYSGLWVYDITDPLNGQLLGVFDTSRTDDDEPCRISVRDTLAIVTYRQAGGAKVLSIADPANVREIGGYPQEAGAVSWEGGRLLGAFERRFEKLDMTEPNQPVSLGHFVLDHAGYRIVVGDDILLTTRSNLSSLSVGGTDGLTRLGLLELDRYPTDLVLADTVLVFAGTWPTGVTLVGVSDPSNMNVLASESLSADRSYAGLAVSDTTCAVATQSELSILSIRDPRNPVLLGSIPLRAMDADLELRDSLVFAGSERLQIVNIARPESPTILLDTAIQAREIEVRDTFLYAANAGSPDLAVYSIANPGEVVRLYSSAFDCRPPLAVSETLLVVGMRPASGIAVLSVAEPANPRWLGSCQTSESPAAFVLRSDTLFGGFDATGVRMYRLVRVPTGIELEPIPGTRPAVRLWPTPAKDVLHLAGRDAVTLFGANGRKVLGLKPGANDIRQLAPGTYFALSGNSRRVSKVVVQR